uniref:CDP-diacylglycerol--inositol 3-phosphatidyltransferase n=1 Tax=Albugo laibachii Nc14 TaxID=890382 RepID=F0W2D6_9STRA|nr:phosphatidylinositol synthase (PIS) putative [Albugo laibachii Nc14]|eukprot:CCA15221.1 phosphatidylinositol synthase (PIS) putative [Albugo laibachii Nc14]
MISCHHTCPKCLVLAQLDIDIKAMATAKNVFLYVPNLIGYLRVALSLYSLSIALIDYKISLLCYACSFACDYFDGLFARWLNQCSSFGAVLDMVTDRCSTAGLLFILAHLYPDKRIYFLYILLLDFSSHWMHMYSSRGHHKTGLNERNFLLRVYYGCYPLFGFCCVGSEVFYMLLYVLAFEASYKIPFTQLPLTHLCYYVCLPACVLKNIVNLAQLLSAANAIATEDAEMVNAKLHRIG